MRLAAHVDADTIGGAERSLGTLLRHLDERFQVDLVVTDERVAEFLSEHRKIDRVVVSGAVGSDFDLGAIWAQIGAIRRLGPDIVHVNRNWIWAGQTGILSGLLARGARVVAVEHAEPRPTTSRRLRATRRLTAKRMAALVTVGEATARMIESYIGLPTGFVRTLHNGVEVAEPDPSPRAPGPPRIGAIGRLSPEKGFEDLPRILQLVPEVEVTVVGDGEERASLEALAHELGVESRFHLVGWQDEPLDWLRSFDLVVQPSRREGSPPLAALEAMMVGVPVVAADVGSVSEAIEDDRTGVLVPAHDVEAAAGAIAALLADPARQERLALAGRERVLEHFTAEKMTRRFEALYAEIMNPRAGDAAPRPGA